MGCRSGWLQSRWTSSRACRVGVCPDQTNKGVVTFLYVLYTHNCARAVQRCQTSELCREKKTGAGAVGGLNRRSPGASSRRHLTMPVGTRTRSIKQRKQAFPLCVLHPQLCTRRAQMQDGRVIGERKIWGVGLWEVKIDQVPRRGPPPSHDAAGDSDEFKEKTARARSLRCPTHPVAHGQPLKECRRRRG